MVRPTLLLTGGSGMVGRNILEHNEINDWKILAPSSRELDLTNADSVTKYTKENEIDIVINAAGHVGGIQANIEDPVKFLEKNLVMNRNLIMNAYDIGLKNFINLASTCMYPANSTKPLKEEDILGGKLEPTNEGYALAKIAATKLCQYINNQNSSYNYKTIIPSNLYGRHDKFNPEVSHLIPAIIYKIHKAKINLINEVVVWGDGKARREFLFVGDFADAIIRAAKNIKALPDLMNCGLGADYSVKTYYKTAAKIIGWNGKLVYDITKPVGMKRKLSSIERQLEWGWSSKTTLSQGLKATYKHYTEEVTCEL